MAPYTSLPNPWKNIPYVGTLVDAIQDKLSGLIASDIPITDSGGVFTATDVEGALAELQTHVVDTSDAHDASAISVDSTDLTGTGTNVQTALGELDDAIAAIIPAGVVHLSTQTVSGSDATTVSFSSISGAYSSLLLKGIFKTDSSTSTGKALQVQFNSDTGSNYRYNFYNGYGAFAMQGAVTTSGATHIAIPNATGTTVNWPTVWLAEIPFYASTSWEKIIVSRLSGMSWADSGFGNTNSMGGWASTSAITSISLALESSAKFKVNSVFKLYGVVA